MGLKDRVAKALGFATQDDIEKAKRSMQKSMGELGSDDDDDDSGGGHGKLRPLRNYEDYAKAYNRSGWIFSSVYRIATSAAQVPLKIYEVNKDGKPEEIPDHPAKALLETVNPWMTRFDLIEATFSFLEICGKAYWVLLPNATRPQEIRVIRPNLMKPVEDPEKFIKHFEYEVNGKKIIYQPEQVIYLHTFDPLDERGGTGSVEAAAQSILLDDYAILANQRYFENDGKPGGVIETPENGTPLLEPDLKRYENHWDKRHKGINNRNRTAVLPPGWKFNDTNKTMQDMQFKELRDKNREEMLATSSVPPALVGILEYANYSNMDAQERFFWKFTMLPRMRKVEALLNSFFFPRFGDKRLFCEFDLSEFIPEDTETQARVDEILLRSGQRTINELRKRDNQEPVPWGDTWWASSLLVDINTLMNQPEKPTPGEPPKKDKPATDDSAGETSANEKPTEEEEVNNPNEPDVQKSYVGKADEELEYTEEELTILRKANATVDRIEKKMIASTINTFDKQEAAVLGKLKGQIGKAKVKKDLDLDVESIITEEELTQDMIDAAAPLFTEGAAAGAADLMTQHNLGISFNVLDPQVTGFLRGKVMTFVNVVNQTTVERVRQGLVTGVEAGETEPQLANRVRQAFDGRRNNAATIARTEIGESYWFGHDRFAKQAKDNGLLSKKFWITAEDERVRPWHRSAHRQERDINEVFDVGSEPLLYPGDRSSGASGKNTINCRCAVRYTV